MEKSSGASTTQVTFRRVALILCGTFSPPTYMHLRMFERARDYLKKIHGWDVVEGIMSPVADSLGRPDMVPAKHRLKMVELAVKSSSWIRADGWECSQGEWIRTIHVLHHFKETLIHKYGSGQYGVRLLLLCGGDVIESITKLAVSDVMLWNAEQIEEVVRDFGMVVVMRAKTDPVSAIYFADVLHAYQKNIFVIEDETCPNDISSTRLRTAIRRKESIRYCTNDEIIQYIEDNSLYGATSLPTIVTDSVQFSEKLEKIGIVVRRVAIVKKCEIPEDMTLIIQRIKLRSMCKSASSSSISTNNITVSTGNCVKPSKLTPSPLTPEGANNRALRSPEVVDRLFHNVWIGCLQVLQDENQSPVLESSPIWYFSNSVPKHSPLTGEVVSKQCKQTNFWSSESPDYDNLTLDGGHLLARDTDWPNCRSAKKDQLRVHVEERDRLTILQASDIQRKNERTNLTPARIQRKNYKIQTNRPSTSAVSLNAGNLATESSLGKEDKSHSLLYVQSEEENEENNNVTLIYRKYKLASTPETTV
uniref:Nicotinamide/nicotinic acid mononucleotide adenylyltransferase 3 n=1 Tax=Setaria digitata TaxID=48799 RepID=A0A915Q3P8_9BILA